METAAEVTTALSTASERVLGYEDRLAAACASVLAKAGRIAAKNFEERAQATIVAAGEGGWEQPHADELIDVDAIVRELRTKSDPVRRSAIAAYGGALAETDADWDVANPLVGGVLAGAAQHVTSIADTTRLNLMRIIDASYEEGLTIEDTAKAIRVGMADASKVRGRLIARTELAAVTNGGSLAASKILSETTGEHLYKRWMTAPGAHYPRHEDYDELDGQTVGLDDAFDVGGVALQFPGDPDGPPEEICNCRCTLAYVSTPDEATGGEEIEETPDMPAASEADTQLRSLDGATADELAEDVAFNAEAMEPYVTMAMRAAVEPFGGELRGFDFRHKSRGSISRKITSDIGQRIPGIRPDIAATGIKDALRYTAVYKPGEYVEKMTKTLEALRAGGIRAESVRRYWEKGGFYAGTNVVLRTPNGLHFELQFHTPQSFVVKEYLNHKDYEVWRQLADREGAQARGLVDKMTAEADKVKRPPGIEKWSYDTSIQADVGITPFREGVDDPIGFYNSAKFERFDRDARELAEHFHVEIESEARSIGVWESAEEPSVRFRVHDGVVGVRGFGAALARAYRQDGVALFTPSLGDDVIARFSAAAKPIDHELAYNAMARLELPAGRFTAEGDLEIMGSGPEFVAKLEKLAGDLDVKYDGYLGKFDLLEGRAGDYEKAIEDASRPRAGQARQPRGAAVRDAGRAPLGEGVGGAEGGAQEVAALAKPVSLSVPPDVTPPSSPPARLPVTVAQANRMGADRLWGVHAEIGAAQNAARAELPELGDTRVVDALWKKGTGALPKGTLRFDDLAGDQQTHTFFSDGHNTVQQVAAEAQERGAQRVVISDHAHAMTSADILKQHEMIDALNDDYARRGIDFKIFKGIEANILADGTLDVAPEVLAQFDVVNAAIHAPIQARGGQLALFEEANTKRLLTAMDNPELDVLVHPHSLAADWDAVATKAAEKGISLEVNGRDMLRNGRQEAAADMIAAAKRHGAKLVFGSDAHTTSDLVDVLYAVRFSARQGVTADDIAPFARAKKAGLDPSSSIPKSFDVSSPQGGIHAETISGGMNEVWKVGLTDGREFVVKPYDPKAFAERHGFDTSNPLRANIKPGTDLQRERATYVFSRIFNEVGGDDFHVNVPAYRIGEFRRPEGAFGRPDKLDQAGIAEWVPGNVGKYEIGWEDVVDGEEIRSAGLFDALIGNTDRHGGNYIIGEELAPGPRPLWLIDHGLTFPSYSDPFQFQNENLVEMAVRRYKIKLNPREVTFLERLRERWDDIESELAAVPLAPEEIRAMRERLDVMIAKSRRRAWSKGDELEAELEAADRRPGLPSNSAAWPG